MRDSDVTPRALRDGDAQCLFICSARFAVHHPLMSLQFAQMPFNFDPVFKFSD